MGEGVIFFTFYQSTTLQIVMALGWINGTEEISKHELGELIRNSLLCVEMVFFGLLHFVAYPWCGDKRLRVAQGDGVIQQSDFSLPPSNSGSLASSPDDHCSPLPTIASRAANLEALAEPARTAGDVSVDTVSASTEVLDDTSRRSGSNPLALSITESANFSDICALVATVSQMHSETCGGSRSKTLDFILCTFSCTAALGRLLCLPCRCRSSRTERS
eukprot:gnl/TRDRNA2_/TRDRNA2_137638_c2_seq1.p1 gnl/TRDRNA2_/TRDRNA2_137638_c2~~gnl/TRDRNA2_/TRDRNA2_137638_c2_seq1.p1  ORF type:complete len:218 (+),score=11.87 gnl/TRDRNA2_/TRDRNA2_137638_c2_seq1:170-823(+)